MSKRFLSILMALTLVMALAAPMALAEDRVTWPETPEEKTLTLFADCTWLPFDTLDGIVPQWIKEKTGISIDMTKATDSNQISLLIASGDLPDLIMTDNQDIFRQLSDSNLCYSYTDLISQYVPNWQVPEVEQKMNAFYSQDGKYYLLKNYFNTIDEIMKAPTPGPNNDQFHVRGDIYEALGRPKATDEEGFMNLLATAKEKYPDMVPMVFQARNYAAFATIVGLDRNMPTDANGNYVHEMSDPKFRDFLRVINNCYRQGYIKEENFSFNTDEQQMQFVSDGSAFMITNFAQNDEKVFSALVQQSNPDAWFEQMPLMDNYKRTVSVTGWAGCFISKNCSDPEAAIKLIAWLKDGNNKIASQMGYEGTDWYIDDQGILQLGDRYKEAQAAGSVDRTYTYVSFLLSASDYLSESSINYTGGTDQAREIYKELRDRSNWSNVVGMCSPAATSDEGIIKSKLTDLMTEYFPIVCTSADDAAFDANFNKMMEEAKNIGIDQLNAYLTKTYADLCAQFGTK
jgi:putative aldouronate transport system substrate-binding protein